MHSSEFGTLADSMKAYDMAMKLNSKLHSTFTWPPGTKYIKQDSEQQITDNSH